VFHRRNTGVHPDDRARPSRNVKAASDEYRDVVTSDPVTSSRVSAMPVIRDAVLRATAASTAPIDGESKMRILEVQTPRVLTDTQRIKVEGAGLVLHASFSVPLSVRRFCDRSLGSAQNGWVCAVDVLALVRPTISGQDSRHSKIPLT
jgi:hypothetical protein